MLFKNILTKWTFAFQAQATILCVIIDYIKQNTSKKIKMSPRHTAILKIKNKHIQTKLVNIMINYNKYLN